MDNTGYPVFDEWMEKHGWLPTIHSTDEAGNTNHNFLTPTGRMVRVVENSDQYIIGVYEMKVVEPE